MTSQLPITRKLTPAYILSFTIALLMTGVSLAGLIFQNNLYPTDEQRQSFVSNDVANLFIGLPILLFSLALARNGRLIGLLCWPGALLYVTYNYIAYSVAMPLSIPFGFYLALVILSVYTIYLLLSRVDSLAIQQRLAGAVPERFTGGVLAGLSLLFFLRGVLQVVSVMIGQASLTGPELAVLIADLLVTPASVIGGILLWRRRPFGYAAGAGLLFQASMLFIGLLVFFILQPFLTSAPFPVVDFIVISIMGLVCFIPFGLFVRGVVKSS